jgi:tRNA(Ile)-lysidine synthase
MTTEFEKKLADFINKKNLFGPSDKVILAVSGGADSTALLHSLSNLKKSRILSAQFICAHINHQLRSCESDEDEQFVAGQAGILEIPVFIRKIHVRTFAQQNKLSIETAARKLRLDALMDIAAENHCSIIATAHQADDNAETIIHRLLRGTGFRGLAGIRPTRKFRNNITFIRPLLSFRRKQILDYLLEKNLAWRQDKTNLDCIYKRNFIRHRLLPKLQTECSLDLVGQLCRLGNSAANLCDSVEQMAGKLLPKLTEQNNNTLKINLKTFAYQHPEVKIALLRKCLCLLGCGEGKLTEEHFEKIIKLAESEGNKKIILPDCFIAAKEYSALFLEKQEKIKQQESAFETKKVELNIMGRTCFDSFLAESAVLEISGENLETFIEDKDRFIERFDFEKIVPPVYVRKPAIGDRFEPLGLNGEKKIARFLIDAKVPKELRQKVLVVTDSEKIVWLWPLRIDRRAKITRQTKQILQLRIVNTTG